MKNQLLISTLAVAVAVLSACQPGQQADEKATATPVDTSAANVLTAAEAAEGWTLLFDGQSLSQWRSYSQAEAPQLGWVIKDGALVIENPPNPRPEGFGGDIITKEKFGNFDFSVDFMITETANSGIFYFIIEDSSHAMWNFAPEYQIIDHEGYAKKSPDFNMDTHRTGDNYDMESSAGQYMKPVGEWNTARIVHNNGKVEHWLNGQKCLEYEVGSPKWKEQLAKSKFKEFPQYGLAKEGHLGLQDHGNEVRFRNIKVRRL
ncbi:MAG: hypothetical protein RI973_47 [Bacteroidota bacterium]|jgi:hypothetical protein